jgi:hypothetical protein
MTARLYCTPVLARVCAVSVTPDQVPFASVEPLMAHLRRRGAAIASTASPTPSGCTSSPGDELKFRRSLGEHPGSLSGARTDPL